MRALALLTALALGACAPGDDAPAADGSATRAGAESDTSVPKVLVTKTSAAVRGDSALRRDSIIGRDSAFGPTFRIDSTGKLVRIRRP